MPILLALLVGCAPDSVQVPSPSPAEGASGLCRSLVQQLPDSLLGKNRVSVTPDSPLVAAWGSPTIALRCGVPRPDGLAPDSELLAVNDVAWLPEPPEQPTTYTSVGRQVYVELLIPASYEQPAEALVRVSDLIKEHLPAKESGL
ncbi:DUF3515 domain-containing protein [Salinactinospora qingdaonensis]|uniref:DUF3515 domain-containing protein n=1 Tax=Salinactinospora qingdaonensis TaxID=702744 RepID=A0ABP7FSW6_9ACTN